MRINDRKKRSASCPEFHDNTKDEYDDTVIATYTVVRAALNSVEVEGECVEKFMCEGGAELRRRGEGREGRCWWRWEESCWGTEDTMDYWWGLQMVAVGLSTRSVGTFLTIIGCLG